MSSEVQATQRDGDPLFRDVDTSADRSLVAMMDATDAWPAVRTARQWLHESVRVRLGRVPIRSVDLGCGPGTFHTTSGAAATIDIDRSHTMVRSVRDRHPTTLAVVGDVERLGLADGVADLVHVERVLQWLDDPAQAMREAIRVVRPGGCVSVTDTDWSTLSVDDPTSPASRELSAAALWWVPHPTLAASLPTSLAEHVVDVEVRHDVVRLTSWDPDVVDQHDGPPGLPLRTIAAAAGGSVSSAGIDELASAARAGRFRAELTLVTVLGTRPVHGALS